MTTHYERLGVKLGASADEIRQAWRATAKRLHPDTSGADTAAFIAAQAAYETLSDPLRRAAYDRDWMGQPVLHPSVLDLGSLEPDSRAIKEVRVENAGGGVPALRLDVDRGRGWRVGRTSGSTAPGAGVKLAIEVDTTGMAGKHVDESVRVSLGSNTTVLRIRFSVSPVRSRGQARPGHTTPGYSAMPGSGTYGSSGSSSGASGSGTSASWTTGASTASHGARQATPTPSHTYSEPLPLWGAVLERSRLFMTVVAISCGLLGPVLLALAFPEDTGAVLVVGLVLATVAIVVAVRSELFEPTRMGVAGTGDQAATMFMTGTGLVSLAALGLLLIFFVIVLVIVLAALYTLGNSD